MTPIAGGNRLFQFPLRPLSTLRAISARVHSRSSRARRVADRFANFVPSTQNAGGPRGRCSKVCRRHGSQNFGRFGYRRKRLRKHFRLVARSRLYRRQRSFGVQGHAQTGRLLRLCRATTLAPQEIRFLSRFRTLLLLPINVFVWLSWCACANDEPVSTPNNFGQTRVLKNNFGGSRKRSLGGRYWLMHARLKMRWRSLIG